MMANAGASVALYWLAVSKLAIFVFGTLCGASLAALSGVEWAEATTQTKVMVGLGIGVSISSTVGAFIDQSMKRAQEGKDPITGVSLAPFATQQQVDAGTSKTTVISPKNLADALETKEDK